MKYIFIILLILASNYSISAQETPFYKTYDWEKTPKIDFNTNPNEDIICFKDKEISEFIYDKDNQLTEYFLVHKIYWLNSDAKIEEYNKVYLPFNDESELVANKARVITKDGKINELDDSKIFTAKDDESKQTYKYYAFEGVEKGSYIEYYYVIKRYPNYSGKRITLQGDFNKYNVDFELYAPTNLWFKFKVFNQLDSVLYDSTVTDKYKWILHMDSIPKLEKEDQSPYNALLGYVDYKLYYNSYSNTYDISSYGGIAQNMYSFYYADIDKNILKKLNKIIKDLKIKDETDEYKKVRLLEDYIKANYYSVNISSDELKDLNTILDKKIASETGILKLYIAFFRTLDIQHELVLTCDRTDNKFPKDFEASNYLSEYLIYFPKIKQYMSPTSITSRLGFPSYEFTNNYGLFIKQVKMGDFKTAVGKIKFIDAIDYDKNFDNIKVGVSFNADDFTTTKLKMERSIGGYYAINFQPIIQLLKEKGKNDLIESQIKFISEDIDILDKTVKNDNAKAFGIEPFIIDADISSDAFVEKAGNKYIFKVGELIGPQQEMYQKKKRTQPVENDFKRSYHREINITIPGGYQFTNLSDINIHNQYSKDDETLLEFKSSYKLKGNILTIISDEYYKMIEVPVEAYEPYRKVINSAADFNKIALVLVKKE